MRARHELLLKKNARRISDDAPRAFYFADDKAEDEHILHIDRKIRKPTRFASVKKINRTLEAFDEEDYAVSSKTKFCVGMVSRDDRGLVFSIDMKKGLGHTQLARALKRFKKFLGPAVVQKGDGTADDGPLAAPSAYLDKLVARLEAWQAAHAATDRARGDTDAVLDKLAAEDVEVERCLRAIAKYYESADENGTSESDAGAQVVSGKSVVAWSRLLEGSSARIDELLGTDEDDEEALVDAIREELREANLTATLHGSREQVQAGLSSYLLQQQQMFRRPDTQVDGFLDASELSFTDDSGEPVHLDSAFLKRTGLDAAFEVADGGLRLIAPFLSEGGIDPAARGDLSDLLLSAVEQGHALHLRNPSGGGEAELDLSSGPDGLSGAVRHATPASPTNLQLDRGDELVPGSEPARTFSEMISAMNGTDLDDEEGFNALNEQLHDAYELEVRAGRVSAEMSFTDYKLQFVQLDIAAVDEDGLRWRDGDGHLGASEWAFLQQKAKDLPQKAQHYYYTGFKRKGDKDAKQDWELTPYPVHFEKIKSKKKRKAAFDKIISRLVDLSSWEVELGGHDYSLPGQDDVLGKVNAIPPQAVRTLLADPDGDVKNPRTGRKADPSTLADETATLINRTVMTAALTQWTENAGESIKSLLKPIPDTQRVFLRQSNGTSNYDVIDGHKVGQEEITQHSEEDGNISGSNDNGAFGKCAPTSYFCGAVCGIAVGAHDALEALKADRKTAAVAEQVEQLLGAVPTDDASRAALDDALGRLKALTRRRGRDLKQAVARVEQMKTSIVDRMVMKVDDEGPYLDMEFYVPDTRDDPYIGSEEPPLNEDPILMSVRVRPEHIQEYLEQTNRADNYRGGKKHMMDFFKDPSSMNQIQLMKSLGPGLIAVGIDLALKDLGKASGLLYGPGAQMVSAMVYNRATSGGYLDLKKPHDGDPGSRAFQQAAKRRKQALLGMLETASQDGGGLSVSMGYNSDTGHVNYVQAWGTPKVGGVAIDADNLARCHMNYAENPGTSSAWQGDRNSDTMINVTKMAEGLASIREALDSAGKADKVRELDALIDAALAAQEAMDEVAGENGYSTAAEWATEAVSDWNASNSFMTFKLEGHPALDAVRAASADVMDWLKASLTIDHSADGMDPDNVVIMPSNTERDNSTSDTEGDRDAVGGGNIGSQKRGSANAADASYFVPLNRLADGWNGVDDKASGYAGVADDSDQFIMLSDLELMA